MNIIYSFLVIYIFNNISVALTEDPENNVIEKDPSVKEVAQSLVQALGVNIENDTSKRFQELREKLEKIAPYVIDKEQYAELLQNETKDNNLTHINFFKALNESDHFQYLFEKDPKSVYLKLKEKMNRDDILKILSERKGSELSKVARRMMDDEPLGDEDGAVDYEVDKYIGAKAEDDHMFDEKDIEQMYWDPQPELEDRQAPTRRIYKGERTTVRHYPFMVSIHVMKRFWCGGVLYWYDMVITSASCLQLMHNNRFFRENPKVLQVRVGSNHSRIGGEMVDALEVYFNPGYNPRTLRNNIAVIRLRYRLKFNYHRIPKIIRISHTDHLVPYTSQVLLLGWGVIRATSKMRFEPVFMQRKVLPVYPNKFCQEVYGDKFVTNQMFCAGTMTTGEGACDHDAGGPAILDGQLVGVISFGPTVCGFPNAPTVFTLVGAFSDWIETVNESMPSYYRGNKRTTFATPSTLDLRSLKNMLIEVTSQTETPAVEHFTPTIPAVEPGGREGDNNRYSLLKSERDRFPQVVRQTDNGPDTKTNMPVEYLRPVATKRSHKGHHHDHPHAKSKESLKMAINFDKPPQNGGPLAPGEFKQLSAGLKHGNKKSKKHHHKNKD